MIFLSSPPFYSTAFKCWRVQLLWRPKYARTFQDVKEVNLNIERATHADAIAVLMKPLKHFSDLELFFSNIRKMLRESDVKGTVVAYGYEENARATYLHQQVT